MARRGRAEKERSMTDEAAAPLPVLPERYEVERILGRGGMATVYLARDRKHERRVAIKVLNADLVQTLGAERFLREISIAAQLTHPHILPLHDSGVANGLLYYVMPYIEGETLRERLDREQQLPQEDALRIACEVARALEHAHRMGILHRDIKPENILLKDGHAILADFGIARAVDEASSERLTATGITIGTPWYMSPEQAAAERVDARSDLYSLACVLYEMLAGEPPFTGSTTQAILAKRLSGPLPRIRTVRESVPVQVERALLRALDRVPADRFASVERFRTALEACSKPSDDASARPARRTLALATVLVVAVALPAGWLLTQGKVVAGTFTTVAVLPLANASPDPEHAYLAEGFTDALIGDLVRVPGVRVISRASVMRYGGSGMMMAAMPAAGGAAPDMVASMASDMGSGMASDMGSGMASDMGGMSSDMGGMSSDMGGMSSDMGGMSSDMGGMAMGMTASRSLSEIASELGADVVVQGSLAREGDSVRVSASLIRPDPLEQVWTASYMRHVRDLFALQRELAGAIVVAVGGAVVDRELRPDAARVYEPGAHEAYLKGAYFQAHWKLPQAIASFERAIELAPTHAPALAGLARAYYFLAFFGDVSPSIALGGMRRAATAALVHDSLLAEAHGQLALVKMLQDWDWDGADESFRRALQLSPGHAQIRHDYAHFLLGQGRQSESLEQTRHAVALDPANPMLISCLGWHSLFDGQHEQAGAFASEAHMLMPDHWAQVVLGWALLGRGKPDSAIMALREAVRLNDGAFPLAALGHGLAAAGYQDEARQVLAELLRRNENEYVSPYDIATVYAGLGESDDTFRWLRRAAEERSLFIVHVGWDARFARVRSDTRFADLTNREMRLPIHRLARATTPDGRSM
jgi:TolB-like protein/tRNA A-37 threonylcarbamoyl transferase component Bud32